MSTVIFQDEFTESSNTALEDHTPTTLGTGWTEVETDAGGDSLQILAANDDVTSTGFATDRHTIYSADETPSGGDYQVEADVTMPGGTSVPALLLARLGDADNYYAAVQYTNGANPDRRLVKNVAGTITELANSNDGWTNGHTLKLEVFSSGATRLEISDDGTSKVTNGDTAITAAGVAGLAMGNASGVSTDDVNPNIHVDNFVVTDNTAATTPVLAEAALAGAATEAAQPRLIASSVAALDGAATVAPLPCAVAAGVAAVTGAATVAAAGRALRSGATALAGDASLAAPCRLVAGAAAPLSGAATIVPTPRAIRAALATMSGAAAVSPAGGIELSALAALNATSAVVATGSKIGIAKSAKDVFAVAPESRVFTVAVATRTFRVVDESRAFAVPAVAPTFHVSGEARIFTVN